ncbi:MAG: O-antigen ligase family protein [Deltaproteobacteria bacterium]|nr:O-antigen ligase family protein [Deltaproteobacteria bacterium]
MSERTLNNTIRFGMATVLIFAPLAFGSVEFWSLTLVELLILTLGALSLGWRLCSRMPEIEVPELEKKKTGKAGAISLAILMGLFLAYTGLQMVPIPMSWLEKISPHVWQLQQFALGAPKIFTIFETEALAKESQQIVKASAPYAPITLNIHASAIEWFKTAVYVVFFWLIIAHFRRGRHFRQMARILIILGAAMAILALLQRFGGADKIYWLRETAHKRFMGPFVNENHYAGYMEMTICLGLGYFLFRMEQAAGSHRKKGWRHRLTSIKSPANGLILFAVVVMAVSVLFSLSRGGILTLILSLLNIAYLVALRQVVKKKRAAPAATQARNLLAPVLTACWLILLFAVWLGAEPVVEEMLTLRDVSRQIKLQVMRDTIGIVRDYPLVGTGMGTFPYVYPAYQSFSSDVLFTHTENDYLQLLSEGGVMGFALMAGIIGWIGAVMMKGMLPRASIANSRRPDNSPIILGCLAALLSMLVHSFFDFNLHIPSNALLFTAILAMGYGMSTLNVRESHGR